MCGIRQFTSSSVAQRSWKLDSLDFNHLASQWEMECPYLLCSQLQIKARAQGGYVACQGHTLLSYTSLLCPPALPLFIKKAFVVYPVTEHAEVMLVGRQWEDWAGSHTRCWEPHTHPYLSVMAPPLSCHTDIGTVRHVPCQQGSLCTLREYKFRFNHAWTILSHSPPGQQCLQPWYRRQYSSSSLSLPGVSPASREIAYHAHLSIPPQCSISSSRGITAPAEAVLTISPSRFES